MEKHMRHSKNKQCCIKGHMLYICCINARNTITDCCCSLLQWKRVFATSSPVMLVKKLKVPTSLQLIFIFIIKKPIYIHTGFSFNLFLSQSVLHFPFLSFFRSSSLSFHQSAFHVTPLAVQDRGGCGLLFPASLLRSCCSCWAVIKTAERRRFHTNYNTIMKWSVKSRA